MINDITCAKPSRRLRPVNRRLVLGAATPRQNAHQEANNISNKLHSGWQYSYSLGLYDRPSVDNTHKLFIRLCVVGTSDGHRWVGPQRTWRQQRVRGPHKMRKWNKKEHLAVRSCMLFTMPRCLVSWECGTRDILIRAFLLFGVSDTAPRQRECPNVNARTPLQQQLAGAHLCHTNCIDSYTR